MCAEPWRPASTQTDSAVPLCRCELPAARSRLAVETVSAGPTRKTEALSGRRGFRPRFVQPVPGAFLLRRRLGPAPGGGAARGVRGGGAGGRLPSAVGVCRCHQHSGVIEAPPLAFRARRTSPGRLLLWEHTVGVAVQPMANFCIFRNTSKF